MGSFRAWRASLKSCICTYTSNLTRLSSLQSILLPAPIGAPRQQCTLAQRSGEASIRCAACNAHSAADWQVREAPASYLDASLTPPAAPASGSFAYQTGDAAGTKYASRDLTGPTTTLALVSKAGTRFQTLPGLTEGLEKFAFRVRNIQHCAFTCFPDHIRVLWLSLCLQLELYRLYSTLC
jgi:hypothetical protein